MTKSEQLFKPIFLNGKLFDPKYFPDPVYHQDFLDNSAQVISRIKRFSGQGMISVLDHSLALVDFKNLFLKVIREELNPDIQSSNLCNSLVHDLLHINDLLLYHDYVEALTGDIPTPFKTFQQRRLEDDLLLRYYKVHIVEFKTSQIQIFKAIDSLSCWVESKYFVPGYPESLVSKKHPFSYSFWAKYTKYYIDFNFRRVWKPSKENLEVIEVFKNIPYEDMMKSCLEKYVV